MPKFSIFYSKQSLVLYPYIILRKIFFHLLALDKSGRLKTNRDTCCRLSKYSIFSRYLWTGIIPYKQNEPARRGAGKRRAAGLG